MADVKWIKLKVGMFDGESFKKIKRAKIGGESFRDKLTAVWFELMDFAGKCNHGGAFINSREIAFEDIADIATMIDREPEELQLCMSFYTHEGMVEIIDNVYLLSNWAEYQNESGLDQIRERKRISQAKWREKKRLQASAVESTVDSTDCLPSYSLSTSTSPSKGDMGGAGGKEPAHKHGTYGWVRLTDGQYQKLVADLGAEETERCIAYVDESAQGNGNKNRWKDWNLVVRRCSREGWGRRYGAAQEPKKGGGDRLLEMMARGVFDE